MALQTDIHPNECYDFTKMIENSHLVLLNEPLMVYGAENTMDDCSLVLDACNQNFPIFDVNYLQFENPVKRSSEQKQNYRCLEESKRKKGNLPGLDIFYQPSEYTVDRPEFVDVKELTESFPKDDSVIILSDDDDVVFVGTFKSGDSTVDIVPKNVDNKTNGEEKRTDSNIRRNPVRSARNKSRDLKKELIYEEDFAFLDTSEEEEDEKENKLPEKKPPQPAETLKEWPINAHERPEFNTETQTIEAFDYTIRDIQKKIPAKKPRLETVSVRRKPKKKYFSRRKKTAAVQEQKVPIEELKDLVESTTYMLKDFMKNSLKFKEIVQDESSRIDSEQKLEVLTNQVTLLSVVSNLDVSCLLDKFSGKQNKDKANLEV